MLGTKDLKKNCSECAFWVYQHNASEYGEIGECRRFPPSIAEEITVLTAEDHEWVSKRFSEWRGKMEQRYAKEQNKLERIQASLESAANPKSVEYWEAQLASQQQIIEELNKEEGEEYAKDSYDGIGVAATKGRWLLTEASEFCGEWKECKRR